MTVLAVGAAVTAINYALQKHTQSLAESNEASLQTASKAANSSNEIFVLYNRFLLAKEGTEEYTNALNALNEALGITADRAGTAGKNIHTLTIEQL